MYVSIVRSVTGAVKVAHDWIGQAVPHCSMQARRCGASDVRRIRTVRAQRDI